MLTVAGPIVAKVEVFFSSQSFSLIHHSVLI